MDATRNTDGDSSEGPTPGDATIRTSVLASAARSWLRFAVPLTLVSAIALLPVIGLALRAPTPVDAAGANALLTLRWELLALAWPCQLVLVGAATAMLHGQLSQRRALRAGLGGLGHAIVPCVVATIAIAIAGLALIVPGLVLLVLLALTGASRARGLPGPLVDSIAVVRRHAPAVVLAVAGMLALDLAIGVVAQRAFTGPLPRQASPAQLLAFRHVVRAVALALVAASPLPATVLATIRSRAAP